MIHIPIQYFLSAIVVLKNFFKEDSAEGIFDWYSIKKNKREAREKQEAYVINKRKTTHVIYKDGTLILYSKYYIEMLKDGNCVVEKGYFPVNEETDMRKIDGIYDRFFDIRDKNRFRDYLLVCELQKSVNREVSIFRAQIKEKTKDELHYKIEYTNLKKRDRFTFCVSITIPKEFTKDIEDYMEIKYNYGIYEFVSKIDKQNINSTSFSPVCSFNENKYSPYPLNNIYYRGFRWKIRNPKLTGKIKLKI